MESIAATQQIRQYATALLERDFELTQAEQILKEIHGIFYQLTNISGYDLEMKHLAAVPTSRGMALSLNYAAQCLLDYKRTVFFLKGMVAAIRQKQQEHPNEIIRIFYAGCGPYAPFASLIAPLFKPTELQFTLLEINSDSLASTQRLIEGLNLSDYIQNYHQADAVTFKVPNAESYHILFSETLDALLYRESYVPILGNMLPQFPSNITVLPNNVILSLTLWMKEENNEETAFEAHHLGPILDVRHSLSEFANTPGLPTQFPIIAFSLSSKNNYKSLVIDTRVDIHANYTLQPGDSSLTIPYELALSNPINRERVEFSYHLMPQVELKCEFK